jgi:hypothetical protein
MKVATLSKLSLLVLLGVGLGIAPAEAKQKASTASAKKVSGACKRSPGCVMHDIGNGDFMVELKGKIIGYCVASKCYPSLKAPNKFAALLQGSLGQIGGSLQGGDNGRLPKPGREAKGGDGTGGGGSGGGGGGTAGGGSGGGGALNEGGIGDPPSRGGGGGGSGPLR